MSALYWSSLFGHLTPTPHPPQPLTVTLAEARLPDAVMERMWRQIVKQRGGN
jgi:hypothetical protein